MRTERITGFTLLLCTFYIMAAEKASSIPTFKTPLILITQPTDASALKDKNDWFAALAQHYLHFRLGASNKLEIIPIEKTNTLAKNIQTDPDAVYNSLAAEFNVTHILQHTFELSRDGKSIHYYAEISEGPKSDTRISYEKDFDIQSIPLALDSCALWFLSATGIGFNEQQLGRFFNLKTVSSDLKEMKTMGKILSRRFVASSQETQASAEELCTMFEKDPYNILAGYAAAQLYESIKKYDKAAESIKPLLIIIPTFAAGYVDICRNCRLAGKFNESVQYAAEAEKKSVVTTALMLEGARALESMGKPSRAVKAFSLILKADSTEPNALLFFARLRNSEKQPRQALEFADKILLQTPKNGDALFEKGKALFHLQLYKEAEEILTKCAGLVKNSSEPTQLLAQIYLNSNNYEKAALFNEAALKNTPFDFSLVLKTIDMWDKAQKPDRALKLLQQAENQFPDSIVIQKMLGMFYLRTQDTTNAVFHLEQFLEKGKKEETGILLTLGDIYTSKGLYEKAFYMYNHAISMLPDKTQGLFSLALLYLKKGDTGAAISLLKEIIKKQPELQQAYRYLGDAWFQEGNFSNALKEYKKARYFEKDDPHVLKSIAKIYFLDHEYNAAAREYTSLVQSGIKDAEIYYHLTISFLQLKNKKNAEENLAQALLLGQPTGEILYQLGLGYANLLDKQQAIVYYQQCLQLDPKHEKALLELSAIFLADNNNRGTAELYVKLYNLDNIKYTQLLAKAGLLYEQVKDSAEAYRVYTEFVGHDYPNPQIYINLARMEYGKKNYSSVVTLLEKIPQSEISDKQDMLIFSEAYCIVGKPDKAIPWLETLISKNNKHKEALLLLAVSYEQTNDFPNAQKTYKRVYDLAANEEERSNFAFQIALLYEKAGALNDAIIQYKNNIDKFPLNLRNYQQLANLYSKTEEWAAVREILEKCIKLPNVTPFYWKKLGEVCLKQNDKASALKYYKKYLEINPGDDEAWVQLGDLHFDRGLFDKALVFYTSADEIKPNDFSIIYKIALTHLKNGNNARAIELFNHAHQLDSANIDVLNHLALCYRNANETAMLVQTLNKLAQLQPGNYAVKVDLGCSMLEQGKTEEATSLLEAACKMNPRDAEVHIILSGIYASSGNNNARYSHLKKAITENPDNADVQALMGKFYMEQKEYTTALSHLNKALALNPEHGVALHAYSKYLFEKGETEKALTYIKQAVKNDAYNPQYLVLYAKINHALGRTNLALKTVENALALDSTNAEILSCTGYLYKETGRIEEAKKVLLRAISLSDKCSECYTYLGDIYFQETECAKATGFFRRALTILGYDEDVMMKLGRSLVLSYQNEAAKEIFEQIITKNPSHNEAFYRLAHIYLLWHDQEKVEALIAQRAANQKTVWDHLVQGELLEMQGNYDAALISYTVALRLVPDMPEALAGNGRIDLVKGAYNNAVVNFSQALVKDPYNPYLQMDLGKAYEGIGQFSSAFDIYTDVVDKYSQLPETYTLIAGIRSREKEHQSAVDIVKQGLQHNPENADLYIVLGREYNILGDYPNAIEAYKNAIKFSNEKYNEPYLHIANIYYNSLRDEKEARKYLKKYLKKGGDRELLEKFNLAKLAL